MSTTSSDVRAAGEHELLRFAVANSRVVFYVADAHDNHTVRFISSNVASVTGHAPESFLQDPTFGRRILHPDDVDAFDHALDTVIASGSATREYRMQSADGTYQWFRDEVKLAEGGRQFVGSMTDITAEKYARQRLRDAEHLNTAIIGTVGNAIIAADEAGVVVDFNPAAENMFGYGRDEAIGRPLAALIIPEVYREAHAAGMRRFAETGETNMIGRKVEIEAMRADGSLFPVQLSITSTRLGGRTVFVGEIEDISVRHAAQAELQWLHAHVQDAVESLPSGFAVYDDQGRLTLCNTAFAKLYGRDRESMLGTPLERNVREVCRRLRRFDGWQMDRAEGGTSRVLARLQDFAKGAVEMELDDGRWMLVNHSPTTDGGTVVVRTDITQQKTTEKALRDSEEYFRRIVENHPLPVVLFDLETGDVLYESPAVANLLRREETAAGSYSALEYFPDRDDRRRFVRLLRSDGELHGFDMRARLHDGAERWISINARQINYKGRDTGIASLIDLTARKTAEQALAHSEARYRTLFENAPVCIHEIDREGRISAMNPRGMQLAGAPKFGPIIGRPYLDMIHPEDREKAAGKLAAAMAGERVEMEFRGFGNKGHYLSTKIPLRNEQGEVDKLLGVVIDITERKQQELALQRARETLEDAIESLPDGFALWDAEDRLITCNSRFKEYNPKVADILDPGVTWWDFMRTAARRGQYPEVTGQVEKWLVELREELDTEGRTREFRTDDGRWFRTIASRTRQGGLVGVRSDVTRYKEMEDVLRDSEALVRQVLEGCPVPILMTRLDGEILYESPAGRGLFGRCATSEPSYTLSSWGSTADRDAYVARLRETGEVDEYEAALRRPDGSIFPGAISARLIHFRGEDVIVSSTRDLTEQRSVEEQMRRQRDALYQSEKLSAMGQLLASVAHELNNPLSVVVGQSLILQETATEPRVVERASKIGNAADRCARIVKTFLAMARQQPTEMKSVALNDVVETALEVTGYALRSHDVDVVMELTSDLPPTWADADQLNQVLTNLVVNAQQALEEQSGPRRIRLRTSYDTAAKELVLEVSDNGPGMPPEVRSRIFEPFFTTKGKGSGTGVGLAVSHRILATHGGTIACDSTPGRGTTFSIRLPANPPEVAAAEPRGPGPGKPARLRVLVVDDEPDVADVIAELLRTDGHRIEVLDSGQAALERLADADFDLILSDIRMPGLDGPALYARLAESRPDLAGRVAFVTGDTLSPQVEQFLNATDCPHLEKPVALNELRELVSRLLSVEGGA